MEEENGTPTSTEEVVEETTEEVTEDTPEVEETPEEDVEALKARLAKAEEEKENQKKRAEKAEKKAKEAPSEPQQTSDLTPKDYLALQESGVTSQDFDEVTRMATLLGKPIHEAISDASVQTILKTRAEERKTAAATQTNSPRGVKPATGNDALAKAEKTGEVPTSDAEMQKMILAKQNRFKKG